MEKIQLRPAPYDPKEARELLDSEGCGAVLYFDGVVKENLVEGAKVVRLDWDVYESMAVKCLAELRDEAIERFRLKDLVLIHRTDTQVPGDFIMTLGVSSVGRKGAIEAVAWYMERLKELAPLWKRETFSDGRTEWVEGGTPK